MKTVTVHRAADTPGQKPIEDCTIVIGRSIDEAVKDNAATPGAISHVIRYEADAIADALFESLPQAVGSRVMARMMERYANNYLGGPRR